MAGRPFLDYVLQYLRQQALRRFILCTGYKAEVIERYCRERYSDLILIFSKEEEPLGTGGALKNAQRYIQSPSFFVFNGDSYCPIDFSHLLAFHLLRRGVGTIVLSQVVDSWDYGVVRIDTNQRITRFIEKPKDQKKEEEKQQRTSLVNAGIYCFQKDVFVHMEKDKFSLEEDFFPAHISRGLYGFVTEEWFVDIGTYKRYAQAQAFFAKKSLEKYED